MFTKDTRTENFLTQMGVDFHYESGVQFNELEPTWRNSNPSRPVVFRDEAIVEYGSLMESGSAAPAIITAQAQADLLKVLDGRQRLAAAELTGFTNFSSYIVITNSHSLVTAISVLANARLQGRAEPLEYTRRRSVEELVIKCGWSPEEVAKRGGWRVAEIRAIAESLRWQALVTELGGPKMPDTMLSAISQSVNETDLKRFPKPVAAFCSMLKDSRLSAEDASPHIDKFFSGKLSHQNLEQRLKEIRSEPDMQVRLSGRKAGPIPLDVRLAKVLKSAITILDDVSSSGSDLPYVDEFFRLQREIDKRLRKFSKGPTPEEVRVPADKWRKQ